VADVNANIGVNIDTSEALAQLKALQRQISQFHSSIIKGSEAAALAQRDLQKNFINSVNSIGAFSAELRTIKTTAESFTDSLEKNKFSMREYFRYAGGATKTFGRLFKSEFDTINKVAEENVKRLQTQYIKMGRDSSGAMRAIAVIPNELDMSKMSTQLQIAAQRQSIFNQLIKQGSTNLLNFGKNTQWAGRQLMVGFTLPLAALGSTAARTFMDMETAAIKFRKVYGDLFTPAGETQKALDEITALGEMFTRYGIAVSDTVSLAADAAAAGFQGLDLQRQTTQATRLSVLGQIDQQKALETTISLQNAFRMSSEDLAGSIDFLNAVENQTVVSLDDITTAIPKVAPVIEQLGGNVKDLAFFMAAMKEGGVNASEGANALKSGLASLINPTDKASKMLAGMGINIKKIIESNKGNLRATVIEFAKALDTLDPLTRARAIEQLFGKFQFARLSTLFDNVTRSTGQAARVLDLAGSSLEDLAALSEQELGITADSAMNKFRKSVEQLKLALVPVGKIFLETVTPILKFIGNLLEKFNDLPSGVKKALTVLTVAIGAIGPVALMTFGLLANGLANIIKFVSILRNGYLRLTGQSQVLGEQTQFLTVEQQNALAVAHSLDQSHARLTQTFNVEKEALTKLTAAYASAFGAAQRFASINPGMMRPPGGKKLNKGTVRVRKYADGVLIVPGTGNSDTVPAMLTPGEAVVPKDRVKQYAPLIQGIIAGNIPGYAKGRTGTEGTNVRLPGGFAAAHFGGSNFMTIDEVLAMLAGRTDKAADSIRSMLLAIGDGTKKITVFTNEVVAMDAELNEAVGKTGSGKRVDRQYAQQQLTAPPKALVRDIELQRQLEAAGIPIQEIRKINQRITDEIIVGFGKLGDVTEVTAEDLDKLITDAYNAVAKTDARVDAAYQRMKEITTFTTPTTLTRAPLTKESYLNFRKNKKKVVKGVEQVVPSPYFQGMERVVGQGNVPFSAEGAFRIKPQMATALGLSSAQAAAVFKQFSDEVKIKLASLRNDIVGFTTEFEAQAKIAGLKTGNAYKTGIDQSGLKDPYLESRQRQSPHPLASKDGADDGNAYETARQSAIRKRRIASSPGGTVGGGGVIIPPVIPSVGGGGFGGNGGGRGPITDPRILRQAYAQNRLRNFGAKFGAGKFAGAGFAASMAVSAASMAPGKIGQAAQTAMPVVFGLQALQMALKLPIPHIKVFAALLLAGVGVIKLVNAARERERLAIEGLADAATLTKDKLQTLGDFFGVVPTQTPFESALPQLITTPQKRTQLESLKQNEGFQKTFGKDITQLQKATKKEAELVLKSLAIELKGKGFATEQIQTIIDALREEAGKTDVVIDVKSFNLKTKDGQAALKQTADDITSKFAKDFSAGFEKNLVLEGGVGPGGQAYSQWVTKLVPTKELKKQTKAAGTEISNLINGLSGQFKAGIINQEQFNQGFKNISDTLSKLNQSNPEAALMLVQNVMKTLPPDVYKVVKGIKDLDGNMLILRMQAVGLTSNLAGVASALRLLEDPLGDVSDKIKAQLLIEATIKQLDALEKKIQDFFKKKGGVIGGGEKSPFQLALEQLQALDKELKYTNKAYQQLTAVGMKASDAFEIAKNPILAAGLATTKMGTKKWYELYDLITKTTKASKELSMLEFFQKRTEELNIQKNIASIIPKLKEMGIAVEDIQAIIDDPNLAQRFFEDLKDGKLDSAALKKYIAEIPDFKKIKVFFDLKTDEEIWKDLYDKAMEYFDRVEERIRRQRQSEIDAAQAAVDAAQQSVDKIQAEIDSIQATVDDKRRDVEIKFTRPIEDLQKKIDLLQRKIETDFNRPIEELNKSIASKQRDIELKFDRPISALQAESERLSNDLAILDKAAEQINNKYDLQAQALEKISEVNQDIINQQKTQVDLAGALTQGDIAAAAQAAQDMRSQAAEAAARGAGKTLEAARQSELDRLKSASGMTRDQIEARQFAISQSIYNLEQQRAVKQAEILAIQDQIYTIEQARQIELDKVRTLEDNIYVLTTQREDAERSIRDLEDDIYKLKVGNNSQDTIGLDYATKKLKAEQDRLKAIEDQIKKDIEKATADKQYWIDANTAREDAITDGNNYNKVLEYTSKLAEGVLKTWQDIVKAQQAAQTAEIKQIVTDKPKLGSDETSKIPHGALLIPEMYGGKVKPMAYGGRVGSDYVPSLLTPGEFVVNRNAAKAFGPLLSKINGSKYPGMLNSNLSPQLYTPILQQSFNTPSYGISNPTNTYIPVKNTITPINNNSNAVYNYNVDISVGGTNATADSIANAVLNEIRYIDSQRIRGQKVS